jgi:hypothetical protein
MLGTSQEPSTSILPIWSVSRDNSISNLVTTRQRSVTWGDKGEGEGDAATAQTDASQGRGAARFTLSG